MAILSKQTQNPKSSLILSLHNLYIAVKGKYAF